MGTCFISSSQSNNVIQPLQNNQHNNKPNELKVTSSRPDKFNSDLNDREGRNGEKQNHSKEFFNHSIKQDDHIICQEMKIDVQLQKINNIQKRSKLEEEKVKRKAFQKEYVSKIFQGSSIDKQNEVKSNIIARPILQKPLKDGQSYYNDQSPSPEKERIEQKKFQIEQKIRNDSPKKVKFDGSKDSRNSSPSTILRTLINNPRKYPMDKAESTQFLLVSPDGIKSKVPLLSSPLESSSLMQRRRDFFSCSPERLDPDINKKNKDRRFVENFSHISFLQGNKRPVKNQ